MNNKEYCKFCAAPAKHTFRGEVARFECESRPNAKRPGSRACWEGFVMKLQERVEALEGKVIVRPDDLAKLLCFTAYYSGGEFWQRLNATLPERFMVQE